MSVLGFTSFNAMNESTMTQYSIDWRDFTSNINNLFAKEVETLISSSIEYYEYKIKSYNLVINITGIDLFREILATVDSVTLNLSEPIAFSGKYRSVTDDRLVDALSSYLLDGSTVKVPVHIDHDHRAGMVHKISVEINTSNSAELFDQAAHKLSKIPRRSMSGVAEAFSESDIDAIFNSENDADRRVAIATATDKINITCWYRAISKYLLENSIQEAPEDFSQTRNNAEQVISYLKEGPSGESDKAQDKLMVDTIRDLVKASRPGKEDEIESAEKLSKILRAFSERHDSPKEIIKIAKAVDARYSV
jgi:hypothetical protein